MRTSCTCNCNCNCTHEQVFGGYACTKIVPSTQLSGGVSHRNAESLLVLGAFGQKKKSILCQIDLIANWDTCVVHLYTCSVFVGYDLLYNLHYSYSECRLLSNHNVDARFYSTVSGNDWLYFRHRQLHYTNFFLKKNEAFHRHYFLFFSYFFATLLTLFRHFHSSSTLSLNSLERSKEHGKIK